MSNTVTFKRYTVMIGNFGSGKTELSINLAIDAAKKGSTMLVDMDIINPYFKSSSKQQILEQAGVRVIKPDYANTMMDVPTLPAEMYAPFDTKPDRAVLDIGGDPVGASVLGLLQEHFAKCKDESEFLFVINPARPMQSTPEAILSLLREIEAKARIQVTGLICNGNLAQETDMDIIAQGEQMAEAVSRLTGIPIKCTAIKEDLAPSYEGDYPVLPVHLYMRPDWLNEIL